MSDANSVWKQPASEVLQARLLLFTSTAAALFVALFILDVTLTGWAPHGGLLAYLLPIILFSMLSGVRGGLMAGAAATVLAMLAGVIKDAPLNFLALGAFGAVFLGFGTSGRFRDKPLGEVWAVVLWWYFLFPVALVGLLVNSATEAFANSIFLPPDRSDGFQAVREMRIDDMREEVGPSDALCLALRGALPDLYNLIDVSSEDEPRYRTLLQELNDLLVEEEAGPGQLTVSAAELREAVRSGDVGATQVLEALDTFGLARIRGIHSEAVQFRPLAEIHEATEDASDAVEEFVEELERKRKRAFEADVARQRAAWNRHVPR